MTDQTQTTTEPVAWMYDLATVHDRAFHTYDGWKACLSRSKPDVPGGGIRNIVPLYTTPRPLAIGLDREAVARVIDPAAFLFTADELGTKDYNHPTLAAYRKADAILALSPPAEGEDHERNLSASNAELIEQAISHPPLTPTPAPAPADHIGDATEKVDWTVVGPKLVEAAMWAEKALERYVDALGLDQTDDAALIALYKTADALDAARKIATPAQPQSNGE